jgi:hypothetical protein
MQKQEYDEAADLLEYASKRPGISVEDKKDILEKLVGCGRGSELMKKAEEAVKRWDTTTAMKLLDEFLLSATGIVRHLHEDRAANLKNVCECLDHKKKNDIKSVEKAAKKTRETSKKAKRYL